MERWYGAMRWILRLRGFMGRFCEDNVAQKGIEYLNVVGSFTVSGEQERGKSRSRVMIIYLDQNKWIDLAKAIVKPEENPKYKEVANLVIEKAEQGKWIFPISAIHVLETTSRAQPESRKRLTDVMVKISNGYSIKSFLDVQKDELMNAFLKICAPEKTKTIEAIVKNPLVAIGAENYQICFKKGFLPANIERKFLDIINNHVQKNITKECLANMILDNHNKELIDGLMVDDKTLTKQLETTRTNLLRLPKQHRYNIFLMERFFGMIKFLNIDIQKLCEENIIQKSLFDDKNKCTNFLEGAALIDIRTKLTYDLLKDEKRPVQEHDNRDINFLSTAIPYCDVVITEKTWKHLVKSAKLDVKYSTIIENDLDYLLALNEQAN